MRAIVPRARATPQSPLMLENKAPSYSRMLARFRPYTVAFALMACWQATSATGGFDDRFLPRPSRILGSLWSWFESGQLWSDLRPSLMRVAVGFSLACLTGITVGAALAFIPLFREQTLLLFDVIRPIPPIAWIPLAILWFGVGDMAAYFIVALGGFFPVLTNTHLAFSSVRTSYVNAARGLGAGWWMILKDVLLPAASPTILAGVRTGIGVAWMSLIAAELVSARSGLGYQIQLNRLVLNTDRVLAGMLVIGICGLAMNRGVQVLERRITRWNIGTFAR